MRGDSFPCLFVHNRQYYGNQYTHSLDSHMGTTLNQFSHKTHPKKQKFKGMSAGNIMATLMWDEISVVHSRAMYSNSYSETHISLNACPNRTHTIRKMSKYCSSSMTKPSHTQVCAPLRPPQKLDGHVATTHYKPELTLANFQQSSPLKGSL
jgi:hypothetical protein